MALNVSSRTIKRILEFTTIHPVFGTGSIFLDRGHAGVGVHVTGACAVSKFAHRVRDVGVLIFLVRPRLEVTGVASGAVRLECRRWPYDRVCIVLVALRAQQVATVIKWFVSKSGVLVDMRYPGPGVMADGAVLSRDEVPLVLAGCSDAVMTGRA